MYAAALEREIDRALPLAAETEHVPLRPALLHCIMAE
jgi:hypothetical protein